MGSCCTKSSIAPIRIFPAIQQTPVGDAPISLEKPLRQPDPKGNQYVEETSILKVSAILAKAHNTSADQTQSISVDARLFRTEKTISLSDKYEKLELIGKGSFGEVRKVLEKESGKIRVMKCMLKGRCQKSELVVDEIEILKQLVLPADRVFVITSHRITPTSPAFTSSFRTSCITTSSWSNRTFSHLADTAPAATSSRG